jgi:hypothetical protein
MGMETRFVKSIIALAVTYTTNEPSVSAAVTIADGDDCTASETGALFFNMQRQIDELKEIIDAGL